MKVKPLGKVVILIIVLGVVIGGYQYINRPKDGSPFFGIGGSGGTKIEGDQGILGRPLRVGIVTWPGYAGGLVANGGFKPNKECIYYKNHKLLVEFLLMEDVDVRAKAFAKGGPDGVDIVWSTVDFWANELPGLNKGGVKSRAIMQVDWSRGGDAIVAAGNINRIEDLAGKQVALALFTPSHWLLEYSLQNSSLDESQQERIVKNIVGKNASPDARIDFVAGKVDAAVVWEPDVSEALAKRPGSKVIVSTKTAANLIADLMVAREDFIAEHPDVIKAFIEGWFDGTAEANRRPDLAVKVLMDNEPLYKDLGQKETLNQLSTVKWADLVDNTKMFGLDGSEPLFDRIFKQASTSWVRRGYITQAVTPGQAKNDKFLREIYAATPKDARVKPEVDESKFPTKPPEEKVTERAIMTKPVNIYFATGQSSLDPNAKGVLDQIALTAQTYSNAYIRVEGNTDSVGSADKNVQLSQQRAQAVVNYLVNQYGFNRSRFIAKGNGPNKPIASNGTNEGRAKNRRTDILVVPK
ncbi:MAG: OmpA family protein [Fimbriimonadaceae bacterium]|nr:OmpA family protein [Fimbriimonadaceae bacterium]